MTEGPSKALSAPEIISVRTKPARIDPEDFTIEQIDEISTLKLKWKRPTGYFIGYTMTVYGEEQTALGSVNIPVEKTEFILRQSELEFLRPGMAYRIILQTRSSDEHHVDMLSYPTEIIALIRPVPITHLQLVESRVSSRDLMFQWYPSVGNYDGYQIRWMPDAKCPATEHGDLFVSREQALLTQYSNLHYHKIDNLHPACLYHFSVQVKLADEGLLANFNETQLETEPKTTHG